MIISMTTRSGTQRPALLARRAGVGVLIGVLALLTLSGCAWPLPSAQTSGGASQSTTPKVPDLHDSLVVETERFTQLSPGQCTDISAKSEIYDMVTILDCGHAHGSEVYDTFVFPAGDYLTDSKINSVVDARCSDSFHSRVPFWLTSVSVGPTKESWAAGDRSAACFAVDADNLALSAPLATLEKEGPFAKNGPFTNFETGTLAPVLAMILISTSVIFFVSFLAGYLLIALALATLFRKTGIPVWKAWVPFVQTWTLLRLGGQSGHWMWLALVPFVNWVTSVFIYIGMHRIGIAFRKDSGMLVLGIFLPFVWAFILGGRDEEYTPELLAMHGYPPPLEGYGSAPRGAGAA